MSAPLLALFAMKQRAWFRHQWRSLRRPRRLVTVVVMATLLCLRVAFLEHLGAARSDVQTSLLLLTSMLFVLSLASGFLQEGPRFAPADIDFLFPAPVTPRDLLLFRLLHLWPLALVSSAFMVVMFGDTAGPPLRLFVGLFALQMTAVHLQLLISVLLTRAGDALAKRLRGVARVVALVVLFGGVFALMFTIIERGGITTVVASIARAPVARFLFFPAAACADFVTAESARLEWIAFARLVFGAVGTLALLMVPEIDFREESIDTTARVARLLAQRRRGETVIDLSATGRVRSHTGRTAFLFTGSGAILWKNFVVFSRSLRSVVPGVLFGLLFVLPALLATRRESYGLAFPAIAAITMATLFGSNAFNFDLRREIDRIDSLRSLPLRASTIVFAELLLPWALCVALQELLITAVLVVAPAERRWLGLASLALPLVSFVLVVIDNLAIFLLAPKGGGEARGTFGTSSPAQMLRVFAWGVSIVPAVAAAAFAKALAATPSCIAAVATATEVAVAIALFVLLVRCFERREFDSAE